MHTMSDAHSLARILPGTWRVGATNFPMWLSGDRNLPTFRYELTSSDPLRLSDAVSYSTRKGVRKSIVGVDRWSAHGFVWRGRGLLFPFTSHWSVAGITDDENILVIRFSKSLGTPAGVDVVVREGTDSHEFRTTVAGASTGLGVTGEEFASLSWLQLAG